MTLRNKLATSVRWSMHENSKPLCTVQFHDTPIVEFTATEHGTYLITFDTGGWDTPTTRKRMNEVAKDFNLGYKVYRWMQKDWVEYVNGGGEKAVNQLKDKMIVEVKQGYADNLLEVKI